MFPAVYSQFAPDSIVIQCGADALARDPNGGAALTARAYCTCVKMVLDKRKPTLLLGGGGYNHANTARLWSSITALVAGVELDDNIPEHNNWIKYGPDYMLHIEPTLARDLNQVTYLDACIDTIKDNLKKYLENNRTEKPRLETKTGNNHTDVSMHGKLQDANIKHRIISKSASSNSNDTESKMFNKGNEVKRLNYNDVYDFVE